jgi:hypothetical protein
VIAWNLTTQPNTGYTLRREHVPFGNCHLFWFPIDELNAARRAPCLATAGVQLIDPGVFGQSQDKALPRQYFSLSDSFDGKNWHRSNPLSRFQFNMPTL